MKLVRMPPTVCHIKTIKTKAWYMVFQSVVFETPDIKDFKATVGVVISMTATRYSGKIKRLI